MTTRAALAALLALTAVPAAAVDGPRDWLTQASFTDRDKATALRRIEAVLTNVAGDRGGEATVLRATALGYRAKLTGSRSDLSNARKQYDAVIAAQPRNAEALLGLGAWHMSVIGKTGALLGRVFGASRGAGLNALDRAVAAGGDRAFYPGIAALLRAKADPGDIRARQLAEQATRAGVTNQLDRIAQRAAAALLVPLRAGRKDETRALAHRLLPLGSIAGVN